MAAVATAARVEAAGGAVEAGGAGVESRQSALRSRQDAQQGAAQALGQLAGVFAAYNETTDRMLASHQQLQAEVSGLRRQLRRQNEQLERKNRLAALGEMAAGMAHEIRNPLAGIQLYAGLLERDLQGQPETWKWARKIAHGVQTLDAIVSDILSFTQDQVCTKSPVNVLGLLREAIDYVLPGPGQSEVEIDVSQVEAGLAAEVDAKLMRRVFLNLLRNAVEATGGKGRIEISGTETRRSERYRVRLRIADSGPGIAEEARGKIFNPFFTTKDTGTGLGLTIVHRLVECHGGTIAAENRRGGGAVFTILLP